MLRNDYIMRLIEQFTQAMALILGFKNAQKYQDALDLTAETIQQLFGVDAKFIDTIPDEDLMVLLRTNDGIEPDKAIIIAALQKEAGDIFEAAGDSDSSYIRHSKALNLLLEVYNHDTPTNLPDYLNETGIAGLIAKLDRYELPEATKLRLLLYYEKAGNFAKAEDLLYDMIETGQPEIIDRGIAFYRRIALKSDQQLEAGNLPREEVQEGLAELERMKEQNKA